ncbi:ROK family protein [[Mycoplasma] testudinis]|uniref:ROK family protein n=1 Tax=[Mycoplasma] testudinis TaxID=33924 RepID=UPI00055F55DF|nr:ROK family protein [[Mycoplasma] testudinis]
MKLNYVVIDIGGTNTRVAVVHLNTVIKRWTFKTNAKNAVDSLAPVINCLNTLKAHYVAICMPGPSDFNKGIVFNSPNLTGTWWNFNVKQHLLKNTTVKDIIFENDANVMALGNHHAYNLTKQDLTQYFTISTGLGAGLILNNQIFTGYNHFGQEVAHAPIGINKSKTPLGIGSLEYYAAGSWIEKQAKKYDSKWTTKTLFDNYLNDKVAKKIINQGIETLSRMFAIVMAIINPNHFIVGGSVAHYNWWYVQKAFEQAQSLTDKNQYQFVKLLPDKFGDDSALVGLSYFLKDHFKK